MSALLVRPIEIGRFDGLILVAELAVSPVQNFQGSGLALWLKPFNQPSFTEETLTLACVNSLSELIEKLKTAIGHTVRHAILSEFWPKAPENLRWHLSSRDLEAGPVIELIIASPETMEMMFSFYNCERRSLLTMN